MSQIGPEPPNQPGALPPAAPPTAPPAAPASWAWVRQPVPVRTVETEPLEYHRLLRGMQNYRWWKPLVMLLLAGAFFGVFTIALTLLLVPLMLVLAPDYAEGLVAGTVEILDTQQPMSVLVSLLSLIIMIPSVVLAMLIMGMRPVGRIWSVAVRVRWGLLLRLLGAAVLAVAVMNAVAIAVQVLLVPVAPAAPAADGREFDPTAAMISMLLVVLLVPFQATAEEVVFRGLFMQVIGSWLKNPWFAIVIPALGFALAHIYDFWGLAAVGLMGLVAGWLTWRTGGLEAAIAIHVVNNLVAFGFMALAIEGETAQTEDAGGPAALVGEVAGLALFVWLALRIFRRGGHGRQRIDLITVPVPAAPAAPTAETAGAAWPPAGPQHPYPGGTSAPGSAPGAGYPPPHALAGPETASEPEQKGDR